MEAEQDIPLVSISCLTYNHEPYIKDALDGFLMQITNFKFELLIHDDASTDKTADIIREYEKNHPGVIKPIYQSDNQWSKGIRGSAVHNIPRAKGKYIALCEGDDYWTDPLKLQKQVDFLEQNEDFSFCAHSWREQNGVSKELKPPIIIGVKNLDENQAFGLDSFTEVWFAKTLTLLYRKNSLDFVRISKYKYSRDTHILYHALKMGKGYFMKDVMGVYRIHEGGIASMVDDKITIFTSYQIAKELYEVNKDDITRRYYLLKILSVLKSRLFTKDMFKQLKHNVQLFFKALRLFKRPSDILSHL